MNEHDELQSAFGALLGEPPMPAVDRRQQVDDRVGRIRRRRNAVSAVGAAVVIAGASLVFVNVRNHQPAHESVAAIRSAQAPILSLGVDGGTSQRVGRAVDFEVKLSGLSENPGDYGFQIKYGDLGMDRAYGAKHCVLTTPVDANVQHTFSHAYTQPGHYDVTVVASLCGVVKATRSLTVVVTR